jgi:hypothetical protein
MDRQIEQVETACTTAAAIMRRHDFVRGVEDRRAGRPPDFDCDSWAWAYERGLLAVL